MGLDLHLHSLEQVRILLPALQMQKGILPWLSLASEPTAALDRWIICRDASGNCIGSSPWSPLGKAWINSRYVCF